MAFAGVITFSLCVILDMNELIQVAAVDDAMVRLHQFNDTESVGAIHDDPARQAEVSW